MAIPPETEPLAQQTIHLRSSSNDPTITQLKSLYFPTVCVKLMEEAVRCMPLTPDVIPNRTEEGNLAASSLPALVPGPYWNSFEQFRVGGSSTLEGIPKHGVATLRCKTTSFRIMRDEDFQRLLGFASEMHRLKGGLKLVICAARMFSKFRDDEHERLLVQAASLFGEGPILPERDGHDGFEITAEEKAELASDDFDLESAVIPRPQF
jgi:hypothetical protein